MTSPEAERIEPVDESDRDAFLLYDGECPFCSFYVRKSEFKTPNGSPLTLIDANRAPALLAELRREGCEVEEGMVLVADGRHRQGAEAMTALRAMTTETNWFGRLSRRFASNPARLRTFYPWFCGLRRVALWMKRKSNPDRGRRVVRR